MANNRKDILTEQLTGAEFRLGAYFEGSLTDHDIKILQQAERDKKHAEHGLKNMAQGKTLESEVKNVLKMGSKARHEYYTEVLKSGGRKAVDELTAAVKKQRTRSNGMEM